MIYIDSPGGQGIDHPKVWIMKQLRKGYYPAPAGYKSWEERQEEATLKTASAVNGTELEDAWKRQERVRDHWESWKQRFEAEFALTNIVSTAHNAEVWLAELPEDRKTALAAGMSTGSKAAAEQYQYPQGTRLGAMALYREAFAKEAEIELPV